MTLNAAHISPIIALSAGILVLIMPKALNYIVAIYLYRDRYCGAERHLSFHPLIPQSSPMVSYRGAVVHEISLFPSSDKIIE